MKSLSPKSSVEPLLKVVEQRLRSAALKALPVDASKNPMLHHLLSGGQRLRARLALETSRAIRLPAEIGVSLAAAVESVHQASLIQDDMQDRQGMRHGQPSLWLRYGSGKALCVSDLYLSQSYAFVAEPSGPNTGQLVRTLHQRVQDAVTGQMQDIDHAPIRTWQDYRSMVVGKSGSLLSLAVELPLLAASLPELSGQARTAACHLAIGYQVLDDICDYQTDLENDSPNALCVFAANGFEGREGEEAIQRIRRHLGVAIKQAALLPDQAGIGLIQLANAILGRLQVENHA